MLEYELFFRFETGTNIHYSFHAFAMLVFIGDVIRIYFKEFTMDKMLLYFFIRCFKYSFLTVS